MPKRSIHPPRLADSAVDASHVMPAAEYQLSSHAPEAPVGFERYARIQADSVHFPAIVRVDHRRSRTSRVALYSHDTMGLGHLRRNLLIAQTLIGCPLPMAILMIAGAREASAFTMPRGVDCLTLPALHKAPDGQYQARSLAISLDELAVLRSKTIRAALEAFEPDVLIVDNVPRGAVGELNSTLEDLRMGGRTRCVLGLRDVLDDPAAVSREWRRAGNEEAIRTYYEAVWVYGDPVVYDPIREYQFAPDVAAKVCYTGYLDQRTRLQDGEGRGAGSGGPAILDLPPGPLALCLVGGGQDGARLAEAFAHADLPPDTTGVILTGPFMPPDAQGRLRRYAATRPRLQVHEFVAEPTALLRRAERVVAMGGYNTVAELLSFEKRALVVPRIKPRAEQLIRAERLRALGVLDLLHPADLHPRALTTWLACDRSDRGSAVRVREKIDLNGLARLPHLLEDLLATSSTSLTDQSCLWKTRHVVD